MGPSVKQKYKSNIYTKTKTKQKTNKKNTKKHKKTHKKHKKMGGSSVVSWDVLLQTDGTQLYELGVFIAPGLRQ